MNCTCLQLYFGTLELNLVPLIELKIHVGTFHLKYKEGKNGTSSVNEISLVHHHDKAGNKYYTHNNTDIRENPSV